MRVHWVKTNIPLDDVMREFSIHTEYTSCQGIDLPYVARRVLSTLVDLFNDPLNHLYENQPLPSRVQIMVLDEVAALHELWNEDEFDGTETVLRQFITMVYDRIMYWIDRVKLTSFQSENLVAEGWVSNCLLVDVPV